MRDISTLLTEARKAIAQGSEQEWFESLTDEEKELMVTSLNAFIERVAAWVHCFREAFGPMIEKIHGIVNDEG